MKYMDIRPPMARVIDLPIDIPVTSKLSDILFWIWIVTFYVIGRYLLPTAVASLYVYGYLHNELRMWEIQQNYMMI